MKTHTHRPILFCAMMALIAFACVLLVHGQSLNAKAVGTIPLSSPNPCVAGVTQKSVDAYIAYRRSVDDARVARGEQHEVLFGTYTEGSNEARIQKGTLADISNPSGRFWTLACHPPKRLSNIRLMPDYLSLRVGKSSTFTAHVLQADDTEVTDEAIECLSNDESVASVETKNLQCVVTARRRGVTTVFARVSSSPGVRGDPRGVSVR